MRSSTLATSVLLALLLATTAAAQQTFVSGRARAAAGGCGEDFSEDSNLRAWWGMNNVATDASGDGNDLTANGSLGYQSAITPAEGSHSSDISNNNAEFWSLTDSAAATGFPGKNGETTTAATWGGWIMLWSAAIGGTDPFMKKSGAFQTDTAGGSSDFRCSAGGGNAYSGLTPSADTWYHVVCRWDNVSDDLVITVDGVDQATTGSITTMNSSTNDFTFLGESGNDADAWGDEPFVFDRALSESEIADIASCGIDGSGLP